MCKGQTKFFVFIQVSRPAISIHHFLFPFFGLFGPLRLHLSLSLAPFPHPDHSQLVWQLFHYVRTNWLAFAVTEDECEAKDNIVNDETTSERIVNSQNNVTTNKIQTEFWLDAKLFEWPPVKFDTDSTFLPLSFACIQVILCALCSVSVCVFTYQRYKHKMLFDRYEISIMADFIQNYNLIHMYKAIKSSSKLHTS